MIEKNIIYGLSNKPHFSPRRKSSFYNYETRDFNSTFHISHSKFLIVFVFRLIIAQLVQPVLQIIGHVVGRV